VQGATHTASQEVVMRALSIAGFLALVALGIWLAIYSSRFVPTAVNRLGTAAVSLASIFQSAPSPFLSSTLGTTTLPFGDSSSTPETIPPTSSNESSSVTPGPKSSTTTQISGTSGTTTPYGLPDLAVSITAIGYLTTNSTDS